MNQRGVSLDDDEGLTEKKFILMIKIHNFFLLPENKKKGFRSKHHIGQCFENSTVVNPLTKQVIDFMLKKRLIRVTDENNLGFDVSAFEEFIEKSEYGKLMINYVDEKSTIRLP